jgi:hypothetical protein
LYMLISEAFKRPDSNWMRPLFIRLALVGLCGLLGLMTAANLYSFLLSTMLVSTARLMFEPGARQPQRVGGAALLAGRESRPISRASRVTMTLISLAVICFIWWEFVSGRGINP